MVTHAFVTPCSGGQARRGSYRPVVTVRLSEKAKQEQTEGGENNCKDSFKPEKRLDLVSTLSAFQHGVVITDVLGSIRCYCGRLEMPALDLVVKMLLYKNQKQYNTDISGIVLSTSSLC